MPAEKIPGNEALNITLTEQQKSFFVTTLETDLDSNLDIYDDPSFADELNALYRKLTGKDHRKWLERHQN